MPRYVIERQFLVPIYEHILVEAADLNAACRAALDEYAHPWGDDAKTDYDDARATTIAQAVELPDGMGPETAVENEPDYLDLSHFLYDSGLPLLAIPDEFADDPKNVESIGFS